MKLKILFSAVISLIITLTACGQTAKTNQKDSSNTDDMKNEKKVLVAYFSATGNTKAVAEDLAKVMDATLFKIEPKQPYSAADLDWRDSTSRSSVEMHDVNSRPEIKDKVKDIAEYDIVFLGYPIWWYVAPTIINTFVDENNLNGKTVYCFATSGGSPIGPCVDALKKQYPDINWQEGKLLNNADEATLEEWKKEIGL